MPNPRESLPHLLDKYRFSQLIHELQAEYELLHSALASVQLSGRAGPNSSEESREGQPMTAKPFTPKRADDDEKHDVVPNLPKPSPKMELRMDPVDEVLDDDDPGTLGRRHSEIVELTPDLLEQLQYQFDKLDTRHEDHIPLQRVVGLVVEYSPEPIACDDLLSVLRELCEHAEKPQKSKACPDGAFSMTSTMGGGETEPADYMTFDNFLHIMTISASTTSQHVGYASLAKFQAAFRNFGAKKKALEEHDLVIREKHRHLAVMLDVVPAPVILLNSLVMGFQADSPDAELWKIVDICFFIFYVGEAFVKCWLWTCRGYICGPEMWWNWFDLACIAISAFDITYGTILPMFSDDEDKGSEVGSLMLMKMMRLAKLARLVKALHYPLFRELKLMVSGVVSGMRVLSWAIVLLVVVVFFLGVCTRNLINHMEEFNTVPAAMFTVFRCFTDGCSAYNGTPLSETLRIEYGAVFLILYVGVFMFVTFGLFNLIMAIFINNVQSTEEERLLQDLGDSAVEKRTKFETLFAKKIITKRPNGTRHYLLEPGLRRQLAVTFQSDPHLAYQKLPGDLHITAKVFDLWMQDEDLNRLLEETEIQTSNVHDLFDVLDADMSGELTVDELVEGLMRLRGPITKSEMVAVRLKIRFITQELHRIAEAVAPEIQRQKSTVRTICHDSLHSRLRTFVSDSSL